MCGTVLLTLAPPLHSGMFRGGFRLWSMFYIKFRDVCTHTHTHTRTRARTHTHTRQRQLMLLCRVHFGKWAVQTDTLSHALSLHISLHHCTDVSNCVAYHTPHTAHSHTTHHTPHKLPVFRAAWPFHVTCYKTLIFLLKVAVNKFDM